MYDIIGDIHGCVKTLQALLLTLGYKKITDDWQHPEGRKVIFVGDFVDRAVYQRETVELAKTMVESGNALAVMGNHEFNAIAYHTQHPDVQGEYLRPHSEKNAQQHRAFLAAYSDDAEAKEAAIAWFKTLPLFLELDDFRVVHACWDEAAMAVIAPLLGVNHTLTDELLLKSTCEGAAEFEAVEILLKGKELLLPNNVSFLDKDGNSRRHIRTKWWGTEAVPTYRSLYMGPPLVEALPDETVAVEQLVRYDDDAKPVFIGHYWLTGEPKPLASNIVCVDYSVAKPAGHLVAYRFDDDVMIDQKHFVRQCRLES